MDETIRKQVEERRKDTGFRARIKARIKRDKKLLDRLAEAPDPKR